MKLTLAVGSIIGDEDGHIVRRAVTSQASAVVAAIRVVAGGARPTDFVGSYLTFIFIYKIIKMFNARVCKIKHVAHRKTYSSIYLSHHHSN